MWPFLPARCSFLKVTRLSSCPDLGCCLSGIFHDDSRFRRCVISQLHTQHLWHDGSPSATLWSFFTFKTASCFTFFWVLESRFNFYLFFFLIRAWSCTSRMILSVIFCMVKLTVQVQVAEREVYIFAFGLKKKVFAYVLPSFCGMLLDLPLGFCICSSSTAISLVRNPSCLPYLQPNWYPRKTYHAIVITVIDFLL